MAITFATVTIRHERRVRLGFTNTLDAAAFTSTAYYTVINQDAGGVSPDVVKAIAVANSPNFVELQLSVDLVQGSLYRFSAVGVPATDLSTTPDPSDVDVRVPREREPVALGTGSVVSQLEEALFGRDIRWNGEDFAETPGGDLATWTGAPLVENDLARRLTASGLPWDPTYGLGAREFVDGNPNALLPLRGKAIAQMRQDNRVAKADAAIDLSNPAEPLIEARPTLIGSQIARAAGTFSVKVG